MGWDGLTSKFFKKRREPSCRIRPAIAREGKGPDLMFYVVEQEEQKEERRIHLSS